MAQPTDSSGRLQVNSPAAQQYRSELRQQQVQLFQDIQRSFPQAQLQRDYQVVFNGIAIDLPGASEADIERLRARPEVAEVYPDLEHQQQMFASLPQINAPALWNSPAIGGQQNAGEGVKVAIIDDGIRVDNPFFDPTGFNYPPGYPLGDTAHTTPKVIAARVYFRPDTPPLPGSETPQPGPEDRSHGTHVAGIAAGVANTSATIAGLTQTVSGVAPRAYLMNYKVFYANESPFGGAFSIELIAAIEDAVLDGADVINNSWGGRSGVRPEASPLVQAAEAAADAGVVVVFATGNDGPDENTAGSPGYSDKLIAVGSSTSAQTIAAGFVDVVAPEGAPDDLVSRPFNRADFGPQIVDNVFGPAPYLPVATLDGTGLACDPLPAGSIGGQVALIERGICEFSLKVYNVQQAGASAAIIYNSEAGGETLLTMGAGAQADQVAIPSVFIQRSTGLGMVNWFADQGPGAAQVRIDPQARIIDQTADVMASSSSRGPTFQGTLKPDVVAPGVAILSAGFAPGVEGLEVHRGFGIVSGTSMAAPHVSGAAALLRQIYPSWTTADVKSALMSTANLQLWLDEDETQPASVLDQGAGRIDLSRAANPGLLFDRPSLSFGNLATTSGEPTRSEAVVRARNITNATQTYNLSTRTLGGPDFAISVSPAQITLGPQEQASFNVSIEIPAGAPPVDYGGLVELSGPQSLHIPVWARTLPAEQGTKVLLIDNDGSTSLGLRDYSGYYANALIELGVSLTYLDVDALAGEEQTLPELGELQRHELIIWFTGDNFVPSGALPVVTPLTETDQNLLIAYLQSGGNLIASGQDMADASDINPDPHPAYGRSLLYGGYLGAQWVRDDVFTNTETLERIAMGSGSQPWTDDIVLDLSAPAPGIVLSDQTGAGNQEFIDEVKLSDADPRDPDEYTKPIIEAPNPTTDSAGYIGLNVSDEPTLEDTALDFPYRTTLLAFGLEGVRSDTGLTTRKELLQQILYWHVDRPTVTLDKSVVEVTEPNQLVEFNAAPQSNTPTSFVFFRWDFGDGSPVLESTTPNVSHRFEQPGTYQVRVEALNSWGHRAVSPVQPFGPQAAAPAPAPSNEPLTFAETGQTLQGRFLEFWRDNGGLPVFGYPLTAQNEGEIVSQTFERTRFEHHPQNSAPYDVLLGRVGVEALEAQGRDWWSFPTVDSAPEGCLYFAETQHSLCGEFKNYWERHGLEFDGQPGSSYAESLALFGMPVSEPQQETLEDGSVLLVQWFERARFEHHPQNSAPYDVLLGRLTADTAR
jgi:subtilisin family serine protease